MSGVIICGVDDSESAMGAARVARALSSELGRDLVFVRAVDLDAPPAELNAVARRLERLSAEASGVDCGAAWSVLVGHPVDALVAAATNANASFVVVGSGGPRSPLLGSVSAEISRRAPCPVIVVPPGGDANRNAGVRGASGTTFAGGIARLGPEPRN